MDESLSPEEQIRGYLQQQGGGTDATVGQLLTSFALDSDDVSGRQGIEARLGAAGMRLDRSIVGLSEDETVGVSLAPDEPEFGGTTAQESGTFGRPSREGEPPLPNYRATPSPEDDRAGDPSAEAQLPVRICRKCSVQSRTGSDRCPNCGSSYLRGLRRFSKRTRMLVVVVPLVLLLLGGGAAAALKIRHDNNVEQEGEKQAARDLEERQEREREQEAEEDLQAEQDKSEIRSRRDLVKGLEKAVTKDAKESVDDGLLEGPILLTQCDVLSGELEDLSTEKGRFECLAANVENDDGTIEGYRYSGTIDYDELTYSWRLGG